MSLLVKKGVLTVPGSTGNQAFTGLGFQPKAVIFFGADMSATGFDAGAAGEGRNTIGWAVSSSQRAAVAISLRDNSASATSSCVLSTTAAIRAANYAGTVRVLADLVTMDADGFTLNFTTVTSGAKIHYLALGGTELTNAYAGSFTQQSGTGTQAVSGVGFQPDALLFLHGAIGGENDWGIGALSGTAAHGGTSWFNKDAANPSNVQSYQLSNYAIAIGRDGVVRGQGKLSSFGADGFTLQWDTASPYGNTIPFLALKGALFKVGVETQKTSTGTKAKTGVGFRPKGLLLFGANKAASGSLDQTVCKASVGASDGVNHGSSWLQSVDNVTPSQVSMMHSESKALVHASADSTVDAEAAVASFDADGFTLDWTTADAVAREFVYLAVGSAAPSRPHLRRRGPAYAM